MEKILKILHVEDNPKDAELIHDYIRNEWNKIEIKLVSKKTELIDALETADYDLVLCDFKIPTFINGFEALEIIKQKYPELPVLFISGTIGEELAVELLKRGATDYILKDKLLKLIPSIKRALKEITDREERKNAEKALWESEERYRNLFLNSPIGIYRCLPTGEISVANPALLNLLGFSSFEELKKKELDAGGFSSEKERERFMKIIEEQGEVIGFETVWLKKDGTPIYILENSKAVKDEKNNVLFFEGTIEDISEKRLAQEALKKRESQLTIAQEIAHMGNFELDVLWDHLSWSKGMYNIYNIDPKKTKVDLNLFWQTMHPEDINKVKENFEREIKDLKDGITFYYRILKPDKEIRRLYCILKTEKENGRIKRVYGTVQDVTEQKEAEKELIEAKKRAEESDKLKTDFLALISHEIRTPLNTLFNLSHLVSSEISKSGSDNTNELFESIDSTGRRLLRTMELILNMATINPNSYSPVFKLVDLEELIINALKKYDKEIDNKKLEKVFTFEAKNKNLKTDEYLLTQVLENLIDNSVKYTNKGKIEVRVCEKGNLKLQIDVVDTGIGIEEEYIPNLFKPFTQESTGYSRKFEGNGIGLALTSKCVELLNGEIKVQSKKGGGSRFTVILNTED